MERKQIDYAFYHIYKHVWKDPIHDKKEFEMFNFNNKLLFVIFNINQDQSDYIRFIFQGVFYE